MIGLTALLDANVLYPAPVRDLLLQLAVSGLFHARWSNDIHREWIDSLLRNEPHRRRDALERTRDLMNWAVRDCLVIGYQTLIPSISLPDENDRHVVAAAIVGHVDLIVTRNVKDFPVEILAPHGLVARHPDSYLSELLEANPNVFCDAVRKVRARLVNPPYSVEEYLQTLEAQGLVDTCARLSKLADILQ